MKAILEFDLNDNDDLMAHLRAIKALNMAIALHEIVYNTKKSLKNEVEFKNADCTPYEAIDLVFDRIHEILTEESIIIDELIN